MANNENLLKGKETRFTSGEVAVENGRKGGLKSGETKRRKKEMRERLEILLSMTISKGKEIDIEKIKGFGELKGKNITVEDAILVAMIQKALKGDISAGTFLRDTVGERPTENKKVTIIDTDWFTE